MRVLMLSIIAGFGMSDEIIYYPTSIPTYSSVRLTDALLMENGNVITAGYGIVETILGTETTYPRDIAIRIFDFNNSSSDPVYNSYYSWSGTQGDEYFDDSNALFRTDNGWLAGGYRRGQKMHNDPELYWIEVDNYTSFLREGYHSSSNWSDCSYWDGVFSSNELIYLCGWIAETENETTTLYPVIYKEGDSPIVDNVNSGEYSHIWEDDQTGNIIVTGSHTSGSFRTPNIFLFDDNLDLIENKSLTYGDCGTGPFVICWNDYLVTISGYIDETASNPQPYLTLNYIEYNGSSLGNVHYQNIPFSPDDYQRYFRFGVQGAFLFGQNNLLVACETGTGIAICEMQLSPFINPPSASWADESFVTISSMPNGTVLSGGGCDFRLTNSGAITGVLGAHLHPPGTPVGDKDNYIWLAKVDEFNSDENLPASYTPENSSISVKESPFSGSVAIQLGGSSSSSSELLIVDVSGRELCSIPTNGNEVLYWDGTDSRGVQAPSGIYFAILSSPDGSTNASVKMIKL